MASTLYSEFFYWEAEHMNTPPHSHLIFQHLWWDSQVTGPNEYFFWFDERGVNLHSFGIRGPVINGVSRLCRCLQNSRPLPVAIWSDMICMLPNSNYVWSEVEENALADLPVCNEDFEYLQITYDMSPFGFHYHAYRDTVFSPLWHFVSKTWRLCQLRSSYGPVFNKYRTQR